MKKSCLLLLLFFVVGSLSAQWKPFRFAFLSDTHIGSPDGVAEEDLKRSIADINAMKDIAFVVITGDITELGTDEELARARKILDEFTIPWYIIPGNHDAGWSESGGVSFSKVFGNDKFRFEYNGITFIGCASGPYVRMSDGHIPRNAVNWLQQELTRLGPDKPLIFLNHYPIDNSLDNWYEAIDLLKKNNTLAILCGHGHSNHSLNFEGIPAVMGRSNLRAKAPVGGYNLVTVTKDSLLFSQRRPGDITLPQWASIRLEKHLYTTNTHYPRPSYKINDSFPSVKARWTYHSDANVISTPAVAGKWVIFGNSIGRVDAIGLEDGKKQWSFRTGGSVYSSPAVSGNKIVLGSGDGSIYCLSADKGKLIWQYKTSAAVLGCPLIEGDRVYIGGSDHHFRALELATGKPVWEFDGLSGPVVSTPVLYKGKIIFGAWDTYLYCLDAKTGSLDWKWNNGSPIRNFSPASCIPVIKDDVVYVVAPDRYLSAIDFISGKTLWRSNQATVRESIGISGNGEYIYGKTMNDTIVAFRTSREKQPVAWKLNCGFGYEHVPSMLVEKEGQVFFGTKNGVVYAIDPATQQKTWAHKIDNAMVNTVQVLSKHQVIASTMDGAVSLLEVGEAYQERISLYPSTEGILNKGFDSVAPFIDYYPSKNPSLSKTAVLVCPGGGYSHLAWDKEGVKPALYFNENGIDAFVLRYRLNNTKQEGHRYPAQYNDATTAMRIIRSRAKEWGIDPGKLGIMGSSAGGHLAATVTTIFQKADPAATDSLLRFDSRPSFAILLYPVISMDTGFTHRGSHDMLLGKNADPDMELALSTEKRVTANTPPVLLLHADNDKVVPPMNSIVFYEAMKKQGIPGSLFIFDHGGHGFGMAAADPVLSQWPKLCIQWMSAQGFK